MSRQIVSRTCSKCNTSKPISEYYHTKKIDQYNSYCKDCTKAYLRARSADPKVKEQRRKYEAAHPHQKIQRKLNSRRYRKTKEYRDYTKNLQLKSLYGITLDQYEELNTKQDGKCAGCGEAETRTHQSGTVCRLSVDYNKTTGKVDGLLCFSCMNRKSRGCKLDVFTNTPRTTKVPLNFKI